MSKSRSPAWAATRPGKLQAREDPSGALPIPGPELDDDVDQPLTRGPAARAKTSAVEVADPYGVRSASRRSAAGR